MKRIPTQITRERLLEIITLENKPVLFTIESLLMAFGFKRMDGLSLITKFYPDRLPTPEEEFWAQIQSPAEIEMNIRKWCMEKDIMFDVDYHTPEVSYRFTKKHLLKSL